VFFVPSWFVKKGVLGTTILIFLVFTAATAIACELAIWAPERKAREAAEARVRGLRAATVQRRAGPLLRQQSLSSIGFLDVILSQLRVFGPLQKVIDQGGMKYRAGSVLTVSLVLVVAGIGAGELFEVFPIRALEVIAALALGSLPIFWVFRQRNKRMNEIEEGLPESIDLFTRAMRAGHNIHSGLEVLSSEAPPPISTEFKKLVEELALGSSIDSALHNLGERIPILDMRFFVTGLILQRETGANLVSVLESMAGVIRERLQLRSKLRAHTAQQRFSAALLAGLPVFTLIVFYFVNYKYVSLLWTTELGSKLFTYAVASELIGILVMRKISSVRM
jgi:tight adherence protein B